MWADARPARCKAARVPHTLRHALLLAVLFPAFGITLPFLPAFLAERGLDAAQVGIVMALASAVRLVGGPLSGRLADRGFGARLVLAVACALSALTAALWGLVAGFWLLLAVVALHALPSGALAPLSEAVTIAGSRQGRGFDYGRVRAIGSIAFVAGSVGTGWAVERFGLSVMPWIYTAVLALAVPAALALPQAERAAGGRGGSLVGTLALPGFARMLVVSGLLQGSHALYYAFGTIHWQAAGHTPLTIGLLWALGVVAEILLFIFGRGFCDRLGARGLFLLAAALGLLRWAATAETTALVALVPLQVLHAASFGMAHLAAMRFIVATAAPTQMGTAQSLYMSLGTGLWIGVVTLVSGPLYAALDGRGFWAMSAMCGAAWLIARGVRRGGQQSPITRE
jgi:MFS transporter, PPP family, 3-phenylpropionic acid transporter